MAGSTAEKASQKRNPVTTQLQSKLKTVKGTGTNVKGKRGRPRKYPANGSSSKCAPKSGKIKGSTKVSKTGKLPPKTYTKAALQLHGASLSNKKKKQLKSRPKLSKPKNEHGPSGTERSSELDVPPLSPEAALVLHDHCYIGGVNHDREDNTTDAKCSIRSRYAHAYTCVYTCICIHVHAKCSIRSSYAHANVYMCMYIHVCVGIGVDGL